MRGLPIITVDAEEVYDTHRDYERSRGPDETIKMRIMTRKVSAFAVLDEPAPEKVRVTIWLDSGVVVVGLMDRNEAVSRLISAFELSDE